MSADSPSNGTPPPNGTSPPEDIFGKGVAWDQVNEETAQVLINEFQRFTNDLLTGRMDAATMNEVELRTTWLRNVMDPRRNINLECGYPEEIGSSLYHNLYHRDPVAHRIINCLPRESWKVTPSVFDSEDPTVLTPFERKWMEVNSQLRGEKSWYQDEEGSLIWEYARRADEISGIDNHGIMLLGFNDVRSGDQEALSRPCTKADKLLFIRCFSGDLAPIASLEDSLLSPRNGMPLYYNVKFSNPRNIGSIEEKKVHYTRVIHLADNLVSSEYAGMPRLQVPFNRVHDLSFVYGGSAQMYWRGAFPGISFEMPDNAVGARININESEFKKSIENYFSGLKRYFLLYHLKAKSLAPQVVDPTNQIMIQLQAICIYLGIPMRIFMGSERGQLASAQDEDNWNDRLRFRQRYYITPRVIVPLVDRLILVGVLPVPTGSRGQNGKKGMRKPSRKGKLIIKRPARAGGDITEDLPGGYSISWPDLSSQTDKDKADIALKLSQAMSAYVGGNVETIMTPSDYYVSVMNMEDSEAMAVVDNAMQALEEENLMTQMPNTTLPSDGTTGHNDTSVVGDNRPGDAAAAAKVTPGKVAPTPATPATPPKGPANVK